MMCTHHNQPGWPMSSAACPAYSGLTQTLRARLVVVGRVSEHQRQHALLLQVGLVDARKRLDQHLARALSRRSARRSPPRALHMQAILQPRARCSHSNRGTTYIACPGGMSTSKHAMAKPKHNMSSRVMTTCDDQKRASAPWVRVEVKEP